MSDFHSSPVKATAKSWTWTPAKVISQGYVREATPNGVTRTVWNPVGAPDQGPPVTDLLRQLRTRHYDMASARFLSTDPIEFEDDTNQYRYVKNDPVNNTDPSGTRLLVPIWNGCSDPLGGRNDLLSLFWGHTTQLRTGADKGKDPVSTTGGVGDAFEGLRGSGKGWSIDYSVVNLIQAFPLDAWARLNMHLSGAGFNADVAKNINRSLEQDIVLQRTTVNGTSILGWPTRSEFESGVLTGWDRTTRNQQAYNDSFSTHLLRLKDNPSLGNFTSVVSNALGHAAGAVGAIGDSVGKAIAELPNPLQAGIAALVWTLQQAGFKDITVEALTDTLTKFLPPGKSFSDVTTELLLRGLDVLKNLFQGMFDAIGDYFDNFGTNAIEAIKKWLGKAGQVLFDLAAGKDATEVLADAIGLTWDDLAGIGAELLDADAFGAVFEGFLDGAGESGEVGGSLASLLGSVKKLLDGEGVELNLDAGTITKAIAGKLGEIAPKILEKVVGAVVTSLLGRILKELVKTVISAATGGAGAIVQVVDYLIRFVQWATKPSNVESFAAVITGSLNAFKLALDGQGAAGIQSEFLGVLKGVAELVVTGIASLLGVEDIPARVDKVLDDAAGLLEDPFGALVSAVGGQVSAALARNAASIGLEKVHKPLVPAVKIKDSEALLFVDANGEVYVKASPVKKWKDAKGKTVRADEGKEAEVEAEITGIAADAKALTEAKAELKATRKQATAAPAKGMRGSRNRKSPAGRAAASKVRTKRKSLNAKLNKTKGKLVAVAELEVGTYGDMAKRAVVGDGLTPDHIPSFAAVRTFLVRETRKGLEFDPADELKLRDATNTIVIPGWIHSQYSRTYKGKNTKTQIESDSKMLKKAFGADKAALKPALLQNGNDEKAIDAAFKKLDNLNKKLGIY